MTHLGRSLRRTKVRERPGRRVAAATVVSLALNALVFLLVVRAGAFDAPRAARPTQVAMAPVPADRWAANRAITSDAKPRPRDPSAPASPAPPPEPPKPPEEERDAKGQVVDIAPSKDSRRPDDARFLAERNSTVEKETRSRFPGRWENTLPAPSTGAKERAQPPEVAGEGGRSTRNTPGEERPRGPRGTGADRLVLPEQAGQERLALAPGGEHAAGVPVAPRRDLDRVPGSGKRLAVPGPLEPEGGGERKEGVQDLRPSADSMQRILGGPSPDHLADVEEGDATALNAREFKYATYINRVGRGIYDKWADAAVRAYVARDPYGDVFPLQDRWTWIAVELDAAGNLLGTKVAEGSGLDFLDREVVRAAQQAAPFPNPPPGLADADGKVRLTLGYGIPVRDAPRVIIRAPDAGLPPQLRNLPRGMQQPFPEGL